MLRINLEVPSSFQISLSLPKIIKATQISKRNLWKAGEVIIKMANQTLKNYAKNTILMRDLTSILIQLHHNKSSTNSLIEAFNLLYIFHSRTKDFQFSKSPLNSS
jgi:hypothetical protein